MGSKGGGGGGGGSAGKVSWPAYLQQLHSNMLTGTKLGENQNSSNSDYLPRGTSMVQAIRDAWDASPYGSVTIFDPSDVLDDTEARFDAFDAQVTSLSTTGDWTDIISQAETTLEGTVDTPADLETLITKAKAVFEGTLDDAATLQSHIAEAVEAFEERQSANLNRTVGRFAAGMGDIGAINSTGYIFGLALLNNDHFREVSRYNRELTSSLALERYKTRVQAILQQALTRYQARLQFVTTAVTDMARFLTHKLDMGRVATTLKAEINRVKIVAETEYANKVLDVEVQDASWNLNIFQNGANLLSAIQGGSVGPGQDKKESSTMSAIGGAISGASSGALLGGTIGGMFGGGAAGGAAAGAAAGSVVPGVGTVIGAGIGAIIGGGLGYASAG